jgi:outer membrane protein TolC
MHLSPEMVDVVADDLAIRAQLDEAQWRLAEATVYAPADRFAINMGASNLLDVLPLQSRQLNTQFKLITIRNDRLANRVALHLALGGGFTPPANP